MDLCRIRIMHGCKGWWGISMKYYSKLTKEHKKIKENFIITKKNIKTGLTNWLFFISIFSVIIRISAWKAVFDCLIGVFCWLVSKC